MIHGVGHDTAGWQRTRNARYYGHRINAVRATRKFRVSPDAIRVSREDLDVRGCRVHGVREFHREVVGLECQVAARYERRRIVDRSADGAANFIA